MPRRKPMPCHDRQTACRPSTAGWRRREWQTTYSGRAPFDPPGALQERLDSGARTAASTASLRQPLQPLRRRSMSPRYNKYLSLDPGCMRYAYALCERRTCVRAVCVCVCVMRRTEPSPIERSRGWEEGFVDASPVISFLYRRTAATLTPNEASRGRG